MVRYRLAGHECGRTTSGPKRATRQSEEAASSFLAHKK